MPEDFDPVQEQDTEQLETVAPEPQDLAPPEEAPEEVTPPAPAAPDWVAQLAQTMQRTADINQQEAERRQFEEQRRAQEAATPRPLLQRPEWREAFIEAQSASSYDPNAAQRFLEMQGELADERAAQQMQRFVEQQLTPMRLEMQAGARLQTAAQSAAQSYQGLLQADDFTHAADELFGGNRAQLAMLLDPQNPNAVQIQQQISAYAVGQAVLAGRIAQLPAKPAPANPRSAARSNPGAAKPVNEITDPQAVLDALYFGSNP